MKCKTCKKRMLPVLINYEINYNGKNKTVINVPAEQCPECGNIEIFNLIMANVQRFARDYKGTSIDYGKCEEDEAVNIIVTQMLL